MRPHFPLLALPALAACGGLPAASPPLPPTANTVIGTGTNYQNVTGIVPSDTSPVVITDPNGAQIAGVSKVAYLTGASAISGHTPTFGGAEKSAGDGSFDVIAFSDDGLATSGQTAYVNATIIGTSAAAGGFAQVARFNRVNTSVMPTSGSGTFVGDYRGVVGSASGTIDGSSGQLAIIGEARLTANFNGSPTIGGTITNRKLQHSNGVSVTPGDANAFSDITLSTVGIDANGVYNGTATGGAYIAGSGTTSGGTYEGQIGGTNGLWTAGAVNITHTVGANSYNELGVFTGKR